MGYFKLSMGGGTVVKVRLYVIGWSGGTSWPTYNTDFLRRNTTLYSRAYTSYQCDNDFAFKKLVQVDNDNI